MIAVSKSLNGLSVMTGKAQTLSFLKFGEVPQETLLIACNFSDKLQHLEWGCPHPGLWHVVFDSDSLITVEREHQAAPNLPLIMVVNQGKLTPFLFQLIASV